MADRTLLVVTVDQSYIYPGAYRAGTNPHGALVINQYDGDKCLGVVAQFAAGHWVRWEYSDHAIRAGGA